MIYENVGKDIEALEFKAACDKILNLVEVGNKYYDQHHKRSTLCVLKILIRIFF